MAEKQTSKDRMREIVDSIETGIKELFESDKYRQYLSTMSRFHRYSVNNTMLIYMQCPNATHVAGFNKWRDQFGRNVMKGENGIKIIAPTPYKKRIEEIKLDPDTKEPMFDQEGKAIMEEKEVKIPMYKVVSVFDVSQTEGKPLPQLASDLSGNVQQYEVFMEALRRSSPVPMEIKPIERDTDGYFSTTDQRIAIRDGMSEVQTVCASVHEIAHAKLHNNKKIEEPKDAPKYQEIEIFDIPGLFSNGRIPAADVPEGMYRYDLRGSDYDPGMPITVENRVVVNHAGSIITAKPLELPEDGWRRLTEDDGLNFVGGEISAYQFLNEQRKDRCTEEVEAESIFYAVCQYYGIETAENSFGYIAAWSQGKELTELRASLETINRTASELITDIDRHFAEICKERDAAKLEQQDSPCLDGSSQKASTEEVIEHPAAKDLESKAADETEPAPVSMLPESPEQAMDEPLPDPTLSVRMMENYGYTDHDMLPLSKDRAIELAERDITVYVLYDNNTEEMVFESEDILKHDGMFGVTREDWAAVKADIPLRDVEKRFLSSPTDSMAIYQLRDNVPVELRFTSFDRLTAPPDPANYAAVYTREVYPDNDTSRILENFYYIFNDDRPGDFVGHSLSVSDIVALKLDGRVSYHYCDSIGFRELPAFQRPENHLKAAEMSMEDDYGMIDGIINNGKSVDQEIKEKKPSVLEQLRSQPIQERTHKTAPKKSAEREI
ncbi:MAG: DUF4316 domain-containing protein [Christensenellaceae bacterium]|nr:DUF4316 domain-containing protein [Christensenellaceae bacterium]